jgi:hypothetical protein
MSSWYGILKVQENKHRELLREAERERQANLLHAPRRAVAALAEVALEVAVMLVVLLWIAWTGLGAHAHRGQHL